MPSVAVVKVGGSLYDLPDLGSRLRRWLAEHFSDANIVLIPGGGPVVDALRQLDHCHGLGEVASHWLALRTLTVNAHFLAALLPEACVLGDVGDLHRAWEKNQLPILDIHEFARRDQGCRECLPHSWAVTSDSLAARVAVVVQANQLVLLKSTTIAADLDWIEAARSGLVDPFFAEVLRQAPASLQVRAVNPRQGRS